MKGRGWAFGAITVVSAIAGGRGVTASVRLRTEAAAELHEVGAGEAAWRVVRNGAVVDSRLVVEAARRMIAALGGDPERYGGVLEVSSEIPMGVGLKSSSSSSVAVALAVAAALGQRSPEPRLVLQCSVEASLASGVSITGAMDDAASCLLGGLNMVDNLERRIWRSMPFDKPYRVVIRVPGEPSRRASINPGRVARFGGLSNLLFTLCMQGEVWGAMTLNGLLYSSILGYDPTPALRAVGMGALGAGLSGTGPSVAAVFQPDRADGVGRLAEEWGSDGSRVIVTETNNEQGGGLAP